MNLAFIGWANHVHLQRWAGYFLETGHDVRVLNLANASARINGSPCPRLCTRRKGERWKVREIRWRLRLRPPDVLHVHWASFANYAYLSAIRPYGVTAWGSDIYRMDEWDGPERDDCVHALKEAAFVTCDSEDLRCRLEALGIARDRLHIIQWGVNTDLFRPDCDTAPLRAQLALPRDASIIFSPRQLAPVYQIETVMQAFRQLLDRRPNSILVQKYYNTRDAEVQRYIERAREFGIPNDRIRWVGRLDYDDMAALYAVSDVVVSVAASDGTPVSLLEAMAAGKPVVVGRLQSILEWVEPDKNGLVIPVGDVAALAQALMVLLDNSEMRQRMGVRNRQIVVDTASQHHHMSRMLELYRRTAVPRAAA